MQSISSSKAARSRAVIGGLSFDWLLSLLAALLLGGLYLDGWAHIHVPQLETFFTPWHGVLYSAFLAIVLALSGATWINRQRGLSWSAAVPAGYALALLGLLLFATGAAADMVWHLLFGIEADIEALLSPTHLLLASGGALIGSGPLRAARLRPASGTSWRSDLPLLLSLTNLLALVVFFTQYVHPFGATWPAQSYLPREVFPGASAAVISRMAFHEQALGIAGVLLQSALLMGLLLPVLRRRRLPPGSLTFMLTFQTMLLVLMRDRLLLGGPLPLIAAAVVAGIAGDLTIRVARPEQRRIGLRIVAFSVPFLLYLAYFAALYLSEGIWWSIHLASGAPVLAGMTGLLLSFAVAPAGDQG